jgi:hypothetical protein
LSRDQQKESERLLRNEYTLESQSMQVHCRVEGLCQSLVVPFYDINIAKCLFLYE